MHLPFIFLLLLLVGEFLGPAHSLFESTTVQDYVDSFVDEEKFRQHGITGLNETTRDLIWSFFKSFHRRVYSSHEEEQKRRLVVHNSINFIVKHKLKKNRTFELELNHLADLTPEEFKKFKKGYIPPTSSKRRIENNKDDESEEAILRGLAKLDQHHHKRHWKRNTIKRTHNMKNSDDKHTFASRFQTLLNRNRKRGNSNSTSSFDWRSQNVVGSIKDQLQCGSCYAFATSAVMESLYAIKNNAQSVVDLSPQQIVDCGGSGCEGGNFPPAVDYLMQQDGQQATWDSYSYVGVQQSCTTDSLSYSELGNIQYASISEGDETSLAADLVSYGPIFVGVDASSQSFQFYDSGILNTDDCSNQPEDIDHAIVVVGYGYDNTLGQSYWTVKNSWGTDWGENGYIRLAKDADNMCGVATDAYYAQLA